EQSIQENLLETGVSIEIPPPDVQSDTIRKIPSDNENDVHFEGAPEGVSQVKKLLLETIHKMENQICYDCILEQRSHRNIIGAKGEKNKEKL
ncbi:hypothetical protein NPIL_190551, partial [Nephila pilipes]